jgi:hypothetical protein
VVWKARFRPQQQAAMVGVQPGYFGQVRSKSRLFGRLPTLPGRSRHKRES